MLAWLWIGFGVLAAWAFGSWLDRIARHVTEEECAAWEAQAGCCFDCSLARLMDREPRPHRCGDRDGALVPAGGREAVPVEGAR